MYAKTTLSTYSEALHTSYDFCENVFSDFFSFYTLHPPFKGGVERKKEHIAENKFRERKIEENCRTLTQNQIYKPQQDDNEKEKVSKPNRTTQDDKALMQQASTERRTTSANAQSASSCQNLHQKRQK